MDILPRYHFYTAIKNNPLSQSLGDFISQAGNTTIQSTNNSRLFIWSLFGHCYFVCCLNNAFVLMTTELSWTKSSDARILVSDPKKKCRICTFIFNSVDSHQNVHHTIPGSNRNSYSSATVFKNIECLAQKISLFQRRSV